MTTPAAGHRQGRHPADGLLLALHDGERGEGFDANREHVNECAECRARLAAIAARATVVRRALDSVDVPPVTRDAFVGRVSAARARLHVPVWRRRSWQAAAAAVVIFAVAAAASPIRVWVRRAFERPRAEIRTPGSPRVDSAQAVSRSGATVSFAPSGAEFVVRFDSLPTTGVLTVDSATSAAISARVVSGAGTGGDDFVVLPGELRVRNLASSRAAYVVSLPQAVSEIRVIVAGRQIFAGRPPALVHLHLLP